jgi:hypothetical protein
MDRILCNYYNFNSGLLKVREILDHLKDYQIIMDYDVR